MAKRTQQKTRMISHIKLDPDFNIRNYSVQPKNGIKVVCSECGKEFMHLRHLKQHFLLIHIGVYKNNPEAPVGELQDFPCPHCESVFPSNRKLNKHLMSHPKPYVCSTCSKVKCELHVFFL